LALAEAALVVLLGVVLPELLLALAEAALVVLLGVVLAELLLSLAEAPLVVLVLVGHGSSFVLRPGNSHISIRGAFASPPRRELPVTERRSGGISRGAAVPTQAPAQEPHAAG